MYYAHYHVTWNVPNNVWPKGAWSVYNITGDEIAEMTSVAAIKTILTKRGLCT